MDSPLELNEPPHSGTPRATLIRILMDDQI
jgi:hypothetical protein